MSSVSSLPMVMSAPFLGGGSTAAMAQAVLGQATISGVQTDATTAARLVETTPQDLAILAANGNERAKHILDKAEASRRLLSPVDMTV